MVRNKVDQSLFLCRLTHGIQESANLSVNHSFGQFIGVDVFRWWEQNGYTKGEETAVRP